MVTGLTGGFFDLAAGSFAETEAFETDDGFEAEEAVFFKTFFFSVTFEDFMTLKTSVINLAFRY
ncbi:MAG: hypothetical protein E7055_21030 [Lentisphaerae bacterium]|nr:hypothetical protein [Lentisphaerota bacterium]